MPARISESFTAGLSSILADFIVKTGYEKLPPDLVLEAKHRILDLCGVCLAGYKLMEFPRSVVDFVASLGGAPEAAVDSGSSGGHSGG